MPSRNGSPRQVLIVDSSEENREVLETALRRRGVQTLTACRASEGLKLARHHRPDLIVVDLELSEAEPERVAGPFQAESCETSTPLVLLGTLRTTTESGSADIVSKPYQYAPLLRRIESLLESCPADRRAA